ncbi:MAG: DUF885 family protein [Caulobacter sp.]|nr:DUF885 family protein [Caulobacter sp.]
MTRDNTAGLGFPSRRGVVAGLAAGALPASVSAAEAGPSDGLRSLISDSIRADQALDPLRVDTATGGRFVDPLTDAYAKDLLARRVSDLRQLERIDRDRLTDVDQLAYDVFRYRSLAGLTRITSGVSEIERLTPLDPSAGLHLTFADAASGAGGGFETARDYDIAIARLKGFAGYLASAIARLREGAARGYLQPRIVVENVLAQVEDVLATAPEDTPFYRPFRAFPAGISEADQRRLAAACRDALTTEVLPGYRLWRTYLSETYLSLCREPPGLWAMKGGDRVYAEALRRHTTTDLSAIEIHRTGLAEVERITAEMEAVRSSIGFSGDLQALFAYVRTEPSFYFSRQEDLLARFDEILQRIWLGMPRLFSRRPRAPFEVRPLPAIGASRGTGYFSLGAPDGTTPGILYFNMAMLDTRPIPTLETLTLHEGVPGHHFQGSLAQENTALPDILRFGGGFTAYIEGWGLYAESLGKDLGLFTDPWQWFGHLDFEMLRAVRLVVDTGLHAMKWSRDRAIAYMTANTSMAARDIAVEIDRYIAMPGQATAYKIGELRIRDLRKRAESRLGPAFDIRRFHDQVLMTGSMPLSILDGRIDRWIAAGGPAIAA